MARATKQRYLNGNEEDEEGEGSGEIDNDRI
jgi:hypothetical protein